MTVNFIYFYFYIIITTINKKQLQHILLKLNTILYFLIFS
jgi:hypothetical protein